jgi:hypothetical protein
MNINFCKSNLISLSISNLTHFIFFPHFLFNQPNFLPNKTNLYNSQLQKEVWLGKVTREREKEKEELFCDSSRATARARELNPSHAPCVR